MIDLNKLNDNVKQMQERERIDMANGLYMSLKIKTEQGIELWSVRSDSNLSDLCEQDDEIISIGYIF